MEFCQGFNCITGVNGIGKTNILDAIYYLCYTKSYFSKKELAVVSQDFNEFVLNGVFFKEKMDVKIRCGNRIGIKKSVFKDNIKYKVLSDYIGFANAVFITPTDILLIYDSSEGRRRFLNAMISSFDKSYLTHIMQYKSILDQKNRALKNMKENQVMDKLLLETYNLKIRDLGKVIYAKRKQFLDDFKKEFSKIYNSFTQEEETVDIEYVSDLSETNMEILQMDNILMDFKAGRCTKGVHRDDLLFTIKGNPVKQYGSQGQIKSYLIALKLAQFVLLKIRNNRAPILLLDDIFEKIDEQRTRKLLSFVNKVGFSQVFVTDAYPERCKQFLELIEAEKKYFSLS